jgi:hypothetical protein
MAVAAEQTRADYVRSTFLSTRATIAGPSRGSTGHLQAHGQESRYVPFVLPSHPPRAKNPRTLPEPGCFVIVSPRVVFAKLDLFPLNIVYLMSRRGFVFFCP